MLTRKMLLLAGASAIGLYFARDLWMPVELELTQAPAQAPARIDMRPTLSTAHVSIAVDLSRVARRAEAAFKQRLAMGLDVIDPGCNRRAPVGDCGGPRLDGAVAPAGAAEVGVAGGAVRVRLPVRMEVGQGAERYAIETGVSFTFKVQAGGGAAPQVVRIEEAASDGGSSPYARFIRQLETRLRPLGLTVQDELRAVLAELPVADAESAAWQALSHPIELGTGSRTWLKAAPEVVGGGALSMVSGATFLRIPIATRIAIESGDRPAGDAAPRAMVRGQVSTNGNAAIRLGLPLQIGDLQGTLDAALVKGGPHETRPDRFGPPVTVEVRHARIHPALRQLGVELDLALTRFHGETYRGRAHLVGRPVLDAERRVVALADIAFLPAPVREGSRLPARVPRLATEPLAGLLGEVVRFDVARDVAEAVPRTGLLLNRRIGEQLVLGARLEGATPVGVETTQRGALLLTDVNGLLVLGYGGSAEPAYLNGAPGPAIATAAPAPAAPQPSTPAPSPEPNAVATVITGAASAGAVAAAAKVAASGTAAGGGESAAVLAPIPTGAVVLAPEQPADPTAATPAPAAAPATTRPRATKPGGTRSAAARTKANGRRDWVSAAFGN